MLLYSLLLCYRCDQSFRRKNLLNQDQLNIIDQNFSKHKDLITNFAKKKRRTNDS